MDPPPPYLGNIPKKYQLFTASLMQKFLLMQVIQVSQVKQVMQVGLAYLWVEFRVIL